jgi:hypothetical protein
MEQLQNRELSDKDYYLLLSLDTKTLQCSIPLHIINSFPTTKYTQRFAKECTICSDPVSFNQILRTIPCGHDFHQNCIDRWLLQVRSTCPTCNSPAYSSIDTTAESSIINLESGEYLAAASAVKTKRLKQKPKSKELPPLAAPIAPPLLSVVGNRSTSGTVPLPMPVMFKPKSSKKKTGLMRHGIRLAPLPETAGMTASADLFIGGGSEMATTKFKKREAVYYGTFGKPVARASVGRRQLAPAAEPVEDSLALAGLSIRK